MAAVVVMMSCQGTGDDVSSVVRRDSAGIEVIELTGNGWSDEAPWQVEPMLSIGEAGHEQ